MAVMVVRHGCDGGSGHWELRLGKEKSNGGDAVTGPILAMTQLYFSRRSSATLQSCGAVPREPIRRCSPTLPLPLSNQARCRVSTGTAVDFRSKCATQPFLPSLLLSIQPLSRILPSGSSVHRRVWHLVARPVHRLASCLLTLYPGLFTVYGSVPYAAPPILSPVLSSVLSFVVPRCVPILFTV